MQNDDKIDLSQLNKNSQTKKPSLFSKLPKLSFKKNDGIKRDNQGKFAPTSGSGGLGLTKKLNLKRMLPVVLVVALVGGLMVFRSFAAGPAQAVTNGKLLMVDTNSGGYGAPFMANIDGTGKTPLTGEAANNYGYGSAIRYSRDGKRSYYIQHNTETNDSLIAFNSLDGSNKKILYSVRSVFNPERTFPNERFNGIAGELPDGRLVFEMYYYTDSNAAPQPRTYVVKTDGSSPATRFDPYGAEELYLIGVDGDRLVYWSVSEKEPGKYVTTISSYTLLGTKKEFEIPAQTIIYGAGIPLTGMKFVTALGDEAPGSKQVTARSMPAVEQYSRENQQGGQGGFNGTKYAINSLEDGVAERIINSDDLLQQAGIEGSVKDSAQVDFTNWSPDGKYGIFWLIKDRTVQGPLNEVYVIVDLSTGQITKKFDSNIRAYNWQPIPAPDDKRDPTPTCTLEVTTSTTGYTATWTSQDVPAGWTTRLFNTATNTTIPNLPANGSRAVVPKVNTLNTYNLYFNDPANPTSTNGCKAELDLNKAFPNQTDPPKDKRSPTR